MQTLSQYLFTSNHVWHHILTLGKQPCTYVSQMLDTAAAILVQLIALTMLISPLSATAWKHQTRQSKCVHSLILMLLCSVAFTATTQGQQAASPSATAPSRLEDTLVRQAAPPYFLMARACCSPFVRLCHAFQLKCCLLCR